MYTGLVVAVLSRVPTACNVRTLTHTAGKAFSNAYGDKRIHCTVSIALLHTLDRANVATKTSNCVHILNTVKKKFIIKIY